MTIELFIPLIIILIISVIAHEVSHGYVADIQGDPTARLAGRLTMNPIKHLDLWGSIIIPLFLVLTQSPFLVGWAKPVPYNKYNLRNQKWGEAFVAGAGPATNIILALLFGLLLRFGLPVGLFSGVPEAPQIIGFIVYINILLAFFNLIPVPPLDGSKILAALLPFHLQERYRALEAWMFRYGLIVTFAFLFLFLFVLWPFFFSFVTFLFEILTGVPFLAL